MRDNHYTMDRSWHRANIWVTGLALDLCGVGVDWDDFMTSVAKPAKDCIGGGSAGSRHAGHDYALPGKERRYGLGLTDHVVNPADGNLTKL